MYAGYQETNKAIGELQNLNLWDISFDFAGSGVKFDKNIKLRCMSTGSPSIEQGMKVADINRFEISQPGRQKRAGEVEVKFVESEDGGTTKQLADLAKAVFSQDENDAEGKSIGWENARCTVIFRAVNSRGEKGFGFKLMDCTITTDMFAGAEWASDDAILNPTMKIHHNWWAYLGK